MATSTTTTLTESIQTATMNGLHQYVQTNVIEPLVHSVTLGKGQAAKVLPIYDIATTMDDKTEGTDYTTTETLQTTGNTLTPAVRIQRYDLTDEARIESIDDTVREVAIHLGEALGIKSDALAQALFSGFSSTVAGAGTAMAQSHFEEAMQTLRENNAPEPYFLVTGPGAYWNDKGITQKIFGTGFNTIANDAAYNLNINGWTGKVLGFNLVVDNNITKDASDDIAALFFSKNALAYGVREGWDFRIEEERDASNTLSQLVGTADIGWQEYNDNYGVYGLFDIS